MQCIVIDVCNYKEKIRIYNKVWRQDNIEKTKQYYNHKYNTNVNHRLACNLRTRINKVVKRNQKIGSAVADLGCSLDELKNYFERLFVDGMSWTNFGKWHIDHILPLSSFDLTDREQFLKACNYRNLQPLWAEDNLKKSNKIISGE